MLLKLRDTDGKPFILGLMHVVTIDKAYSHAYGNHIVIQTSDGRTIRAIDKLEDLPEAITLQTKALKELS